MYIRTCDDLNFCCPHIKNCFLSESSFVTVTLVPHTILVIQTERQHNSYHIQSIPYKREGILCVLYLVI